MGPLGPGCMRKVRTQPQGCRFKLGLQGFLHGPSCGAPKIVESQALGERVVVETPSGLPAPVCFLWFPPHIRYRTWWQITFPPRALACFPGGSARYRVRDAQGPPPDREEVVGSVRRGCCGRGHGRRSQASRDPAEGCGPINCPCWVADRLWESSWSPGQPHRSLQAQA